MYKLKSVKFWFAAFILVTATVFVPLGYINGTLWMGTVTLVGNGYFLANVKSKKKE